MLSYRADALMFGTCHSRACGCHVVLGLGLDASASSNRTLVVLNL